MKQISPARLGGYECDRCHQEFPFVIAQGEHCLCVQCFSIENHRGEEEQGSSQEEQETFSNQ